MSAPFLRGDTIINRARPLLAPMTVTRCEPHPGGWMVHYEISYHPDCSPIIGVIPAEMAESVPCKNEGFAATRNDGGCLRCEADCGEICR